MTWIEFSYTHKSQFHHQNYLPCKTMINMMMYVKCLVQSGIKSSKQTSHFLFLCHFQLILIVIFFNKQILFLGVMLGTCQYFQPHYCKPSVCSVILILVSKLCARAVRLTEREPASKRLRRQREGTYRKLQLLNQAENLSGGQLALPWKLRKSSPRM